MKSQAKSIMLIHNGFEEFQENYPFLCVSKDSSADLIVILFILKIVPK
jgi:hypothetical protein